MACSGLLSWPQPHWKPVGSAWACCSCQSDQHNHVAWLVTNAGWRMGCHPTAVCDQAGDQYEEEVPGCCGCVWFFHTLLRLPFVKWINCSIANMSWFFKLQLSNPPNTKRVISCLALAEKIWQIFHGRNPHTQLCCSSHKCMFLTNGAPFERELYRLSNGIRCIAKKHCNHREIIDQTQISLLFVQSFYTYTYV